MAARNAHRARAYLYAESSSTPCCSIEPAAGGRAGLGTREEAHVARRHVLHLGIEARILEVVREGREEKTAKRAGIGRSRYRGRYQIKFHARITMGANVDLKNRAA